ncbi:putative ribonuclease Z [Actinoplanes missouriensis 431]|uniref:Ribonuclease Z n=1 Tax=Actinoplanes missouriensis (strain ATCC 14538 / DSM 43046 / CBS 188.64 / JCM 3121 / NBRC 102363 / NCIMB 12654 / NRRL B-3342 / UNCC 431) TaxID=512565 RepID=I0GZ17_ACTM4|nr:ribonuclease Z [Actinoplanes missouriensis]BAL86004.1 putative ribonuclease Z [Actinoplanes missouriensis 431]
MRELIVLGTASQVPTRHRNHNGYLLRWDDEVILFDPGEGTQRQMLLAGQAVTPLKHICITHFHGDHSLGLPGILQRVSLDKVPHPVAVHYPAGGQEFYDRLRHATSYWDNAEIVPSPVGAGFAVETCAGRLTALPLRHSIEAYGYRLTEPDSRRILPALLVQHGIQGPAVGELQRAGRLGEVTLEQVSTVRPGQSFAFVMDTGLCDNVYALADGVDMLVIESTFLAEDAAMAAQVGHLTAGQAAAVARESGVRTLVLTHFSQRYQDPSRFLEEARTEFAGPVVIAEDLLRVPVPPRLLSQE